jgi:hypothetical protein
VTQIGTAYVKITADTDELNRGLKKSESSISKFGKGLAVAGAAGVAIGVATDFLIDSVKAAQESERVSAQLQKQVEATGASYEDYQEQIDATISSTSALAAVDDEDLSESFTKLVSSTGDVEDALAGMQAATDLAAARGISLETATKGIEKAMNGSVAGLKKYGIALDKNASRTEVLDALQKKFGGSAEAYGNTAAGAQEKFGIAMENLKETIGTALLPLVTKFFTYATKGLIAFEKHWPEIERVIKQVVTVVAPYLKSLGDSIVLVAKIVADVVRLISAIANGEWSRAWELLKNIVVNYVKLIVNVVENMPIVKAVTYAIGRAIDALTNMIDAVKRAAGKVGDAIVDGITAYLNIYVKIGQLVLDGIQKAATWVVAHFGTPFAKVVAKIVDAATDVLDFGASLGAKVLAGIRAAGSWVISNLGQPFAGLAAKIKEKLLDALAGIGEWIKDQIRKIPGIGILEKFGAGLGSLGVPGLSMAPASYSAAVAGGGGGATGVSARAGGGVGALGSGTTGRALKLPGVGSLGSRDLAPIEVRVFIGDQELRGIVRTEVVASDTGLARALLAGARR